MDYIQAREYIDTAYLRGSIYGVEATVALLRTLNNPQERQRIIHIAGTNGKGSVGTFIAQVLMAAGYKVGRFVSPTIYCYEERFQVNGEYISHNKIADVITEVAQAVDKIDYNPTGFEIETAAALCYFSKENCDFSIIECGLGGKNDATNAIENNFLTVLTSISLDHMALIGNTVEEIAQEKSGIIKKDTYVVSANQCEAVAGIIKNKCKALDVGYTFVDNADILNRAFNYNLQSFDYKEYSQIKTAMLGDYQYENAAVAIECINAVKGKGYNISDTALYEGMSKAHWGGRFEIVSQNPIFILDGAHNADAAVRLKNSLNMYFGDKRLIFIMGIFADKDYESIAEIMAPMADKIFAIKPPSARGLEAGKLASVIKKYNNNVCEADLKRAAEYCYSSREYVTVAFGSLSFMGEITEYIKEFKEH